MEHDVADRVVLIALVHRALGHVPEAHGLLAAAQVRVRRRGPRPFLFFFSFSDRPDPERARRRAVPVPVRCAGAAVRLQVRTARELLQPPDLVLELPDPRPARRAACPARQLRVPIGKPAGEVVELRGPLRKLRVPLGEQGPDGRRAPPSALQGWRQRSDLFPNHPCPLGIRKRFGRESPESCCNSRKVAPITSCNAVRQDRAQLPVHSAPGHQPVPAPAGRKPVN